MTDEPVSETWTIVDILDHEPWSEVIRALRKIKSDEEIIGLFYPKSWDDEIHMRNLVREWLAIAC